MGNIITIGYITEGRTDVRFLQNIIHRTFQEVSFDCNSEIEVFEPQFLEIKKGPFMENVLEASRQAVKKGLLVLCVHSDADDLTDRKVFLNKINPAMEAVKDSKENVCRNLIAIVPVQMTEAWMLADTALLKDEIGTDKSDNELGINRDPESLSDPKNIIIRAIKIAFSGATYRHRMRQLTISELYQPVGQKIDISKLECIPSYLKFKESVKMAFQKLNYLN